MPGGNVHPAALRLMTCTGNLRACCTAFVPGVAVGSYRAGWFCPCVCHALDGSVFFIVPVCAMPTPALSLLCHAHITGLCRPSWARSFQLCLNSMCNACCPVTHWLHGSTLCCPVWIIQEYLGTCVPELSVISKPKSWEALGSFYCTLFIFPFPPTPHTTWGNSTGCSQMVTYKHHYE